MKDFYLSETEEKSCKVKYNRNNGRLTWTVSADVTLAGWQISRLSDELGTQEQAEMLPFEGITLETKGSLASSVEIMLGGTESAYKRNLTHTVTQVRRIVPKKGGDGREDALEIEAGDGAKTILIFKTLPELQK